MDVNITAGVVVAVSFLLGHWSGYRRGKAEVMETWEEWMDKFLKKEGEK